MGYKIVLTFDRTMASNYNGLMFLGFSVCIPQGIMPDWLYYPIFCPSAKAGKDGRMVHANYGSRKIEAALLANGFSSDEVAVVHPDHIDKAVGPETKIVGISTTDPLGIGPATSTFTELLGGEGRMAVKLRKLLLSKSIRKYKPVVCIGGPGAWQLAIKPEKRAALGIDFVVVGEGDVTAPLLYKRILNGEKDIDPVHKGLPALDDAIADIVNASTIGIIEITRGCARSCAFCVPTLRKVRSRPIEQILAEVQVNIKSGSTGALLHGEDILLYQSDGLRVNAPAVIDLLDKVRHAPGVNWVGASHASLSSAASAPEAIEGISKILGLGTKKSPSGFFQVGIETGSPRLIEKHMRGKVYPFKPDEWPEVVRKGFEICHNNHFTNSGTIILGLPGEQDEDIVQTIAVARSLLPYKSILVPLLFTPMETTRLEYGKGLRKNELKPLHHELITVCWIHNLHWLPAIWKDYSHNSNVVLKMTINTLMKVFTPIVRRNMQRNARKHGFVI